jgi:hypothetical protein
MPRGLRTRAFNRYPALLLTILLLTLFLANLPFYSGSTLGPTLSWRMEHARLTIQRRPSQNPESFYIAPNSEGLRWGWDFHYNAPKDWFIRVPLWTPILLSLAWTIYAWFPRRRGSDTCRECGYSLLNLAPDLPCPECGRPQRQPRA